MIKSAKHATKCVGTGIDQSHPCLRAHCATFDNITRLDILFLTYRRAGRTPGSGTKIRLSRIGVSFRITTSSIIEIQDIFIKITYGH